jgi:hypothetical protein
MSCCGNAKKAFYPIVAAHRVAQARRIVADQQTLIAKLAAAN